MKIMLIIIIDDHTQGEYRNVKMKTAVTYNRKNVRKEFFDKFPTIWIPRFNCFH